MQAVLIDYLSKRISKHVAKKHINNLRNDDELRLIYNIIFNQGECDKSNDWSMSSLFILGCHYFIVGLIFEAKYFFEKGTKYNCKDCMNALGVIYDSVEDNERKAIEMYLKSGTQESLYNLGSLYFYMNQTQTAISFLEEATKTIECNDSYRLLAKCYKKTHQPQKMIAALKKINSYRSNNDLFEHYKRSCDQYEVIDGLEYFNRIKNISFWTLLFKHYIFEDMPFEDDGKIINHLKNLSFEKDQLPNIVKYILF